MFLLTNLINGFEKCYDKNNIKIKNFVHDIFYALANLSEYEKNSELFALILVTIH